MWYDKCKGANVLASSILVLLCCGTPTEHQSTGNDHPGQVKVAAYNVEYSKNATALEIGEALKDHDYDIICFSEAPGGNWTKEIGTLMGLPHTVVGKYSTAGHQDKFKTIASRFPLYEPVEVLMGDTLHTATRAKVKVDNQELVIYSVHFPFGWRDQAHVDETTHKVQTLVQYLSDRQEKELAIVAGDFNFIPINADTVNLYHQMFTEIGLDVTWTALGIDCTRLNTYNALEPADDGNGEVIDHIMYNTNMMKPVAGNVLEMEKHLSDHKLVWATLELKE
ncbi:MAG: endonuclease/exonuclease/phosphatase family protein [Saprospiraceae bacterium]|nr:endonuclease/exonuclease/phosphatase family protein [Saprospiraceae bacterium]